jgi:ferredoxin
MPDLQFAATINGRKVTRSAKPHQRLLDFIRDDLNLTGNKEGCGAGECGTCSVFVDGVLMKSCLLPVAKAHGTTIETVEALAKTGELSVQRFAPIRSLIGRKSRSGLAAISAAAPAIRRSSTQSSWRAMCRTVACRRLC